MENEFRIYGIPDILEPIASTELNKSSKGVSASFTCIIVIYDSKRNGYRMDIRGEVRNLCSDSRQREPDICSGQIEASRNYKMDWTIVRLTGSAESKYLARDPVFVFRLFNIYYCKTHSLSL